MSLLLGECSRGSHPRPGWRAGPPSFQPSPGPSQERPQQPVIRTAEEVSDQWKNWSQNNSGMSINENILQNPKAHNERIITGPNSQWANSPTQKTRTAYIGSTPPKDLSVNPGPNFNAWTTVKPEDRSNPKPGIPSAIASGIAQATPKAPHPPISNTTGLTWKGDGTDEGSPMDGNTGDLLPTNKELDDRKKLIQSRIGGSDEQASNQARGSYEIEALTKKIDQTEDPVQKAELEVQRQMKATEVYGEKHGRIKDVDPAILAEAQRRNPPQSPTTPPKPG